MQRRLQEEGEEMEEEEEQREEEEEEAINNHNDNNNSNHTEEKVGRPDLHSKNLSPDNTELSVGVFLIHQISPTLGIWLLLLMVFLVQSTK